MKKEIYPRDLGFKMPSEWAEHERTFMEWPIKEADWPEPFEEVLEVFSDIVKKISQFEPVTLIATPDLANQARQMCGSSAEVVEMEHDDSWMRDNGPTFVTNSKGERLGINWIFNAWGGKFPYEKDNLVASKILEIFKVQCENAPIIMEGGSIHVDGEGTLLTTEECLLNKNRNPHLKKEEIEEYLKKYLSAEKVIWLKKGIYGDDTDGHVDNVACFAKPGVVLIQTSKNQDDPNYELSQKNLSILRNSTDAKGRRFEIIELPQPQQSFYEDSLLTFSYTNFYFVNGGIILPIFGGNCIETDKMAEDILSDVFHDREIITVNGRVIARGGGNVHCLTQQMPKGISESF